MTWVPTVREVQQAEALARLEASTYQLTDQLRLHRQLEDLVRHVLHTDEGWGDVRPRIVQTLLDLTALRGQQEAATR